MSADVESAICADSGNLDTYNKNLSGKILCIPNSLGSTSTGAVWQRVASLGVAPKAVLFSQAIDSLAAGGLLVADIWIGKKIYAVDKLGDEFIKVIQNGDQIQINKNGIIIIP